MSSVLLQPRVAFLLLDLEAGGGVVFVLNLASELMRRGVCCKVFSLCGSNKLQEDFQRQGLPVACVVEGRLIFEDRILALLQELKAFSPTAVVASVGGEPCETLRYLPRGLQRICVAHLALPRYFSDAALYWRDADVIVGVSDYVCRGLRKAFQGMRAEIRCIEPGIPIPEKHARREAILAGQPLRLLYLGRLEDAAKRVRIFPSIFQRLQSSGIPFTWTIAGDGSERAYLESRMISTRPDQKVDFLGIVPYGKVPALLAEHDVFLLTSDTEAFCLSLHEAMACGLTPVVSAIPGSVSEAVTPKTGLSVPMSPSEGYADAVIWLHHHRKETVRLGDAARELIGKRYSLEAMGEHWMPLLKGNAEAAWPQGWKIKPPRGTKSPLYFSVPMRWLRRLWMHSR